MNLVHQSFQHHLIVHTCNPSTIWVRCIINRLFMVPLEFHQPGPTKQQLNLENLHLEDSSLPETVEFVAVLGQFGLKQHVTESTHVSGGWLDVVVTRDDCRVSDVIVSPPTFSDHG